LEEAAEEACRPAREEILIHPRVQKAPSRQEKNHLVAEVRIGVDDGYCLPLPLEEEEEKKGARRPAREETLIQQRVQKVPLRQMKNHLVSEVRTGVDDG
jgi:hypothetical protein